MYAAESNFRQEAGKYALRFVQNGMILGIGTGRTTGFFIDQLGEKFQTGELKEIRAVPTSEESAMKLKVFGIPIVSLAEFPVLDLAVDGADEVDPNLDLIKGLGKALLREKVVEIHAKQFVVVVDESKIVPCLGYSCPLPVEILPFEARRHVKWLETLGCRAELWLEADGSPTITDNGNFLARCWFDGGIPDPGELNRILNDRPGILEHGLFLQMATRVIVAGETGIRLLEKEHAG